MRASAWPGKWNLEQFPERLQEWRDRDLPPDAVFDIVARWTDSRQDRPYDGDVLPVEGEFPDIYVVQARIRDLDGRPVEPNGRWLNCIYEVREDTHLIVCEHIGNL